MYNFELKIEKHEKQYKIIVVESPRRHQLGQSEPLQRGDRFEELLEFAQERLAEEADIKALGHQLFNLLFPSQIRDHFLRSSPKYDQEPIRISLWVPEDLPELHDIPWEILYDPNYDSRREFFALDKQTPIVRYVLTAGSELKPHKGKWKVMVATASPTNLAKLDVEDEITHLKTILSPQEERLKISWPLPDETYDEFLDRFESFKPHILHYAGHASLDETGKGVLCLVGEDGKSRNLSDDTLGGLMSKSPLRLVLLNACQTGKSDEMTQRYRTIAYQVAKAGIPFVIGMQWNIYDESALIFARGFYNALVAENAYIEEAVNEGRWRLKERFPTENRWANPVLFASIRRPLRVPSSRGKSTLDIIREQLNELLDQDILEPFHHNIEKLVRAAKANRYDVNTLGKLISLFKQIEHDIQMGMTLSTVYSQIHDGSYFLNHADLKHLLYAQQQIVDLTLRGLRVIEFPVVLAVMNNKEAQELENESVFAGSYRELISDYRQLVGYLQANGIDSWVDRYKPDPKHWQPFYQNESPKSIARIITEMLDKQESPYPIVPVYYDIRTINSDKNRSALLDLRRMGSLVVIDTISLHHPLMQREYKLSMLDAFPNTHVASVAPLESMFADLNHKLIVVIPSNNDLEFRKRLKVYDDRCDQVDSDYRVSRLINANLNFLLPKNQPNDEWFKGRSQR